MTMQLYHVAECHECGAVRRLLRQNALAFESMVVPRDERQPVKERFGHESVPVLVDGDFVSAELGEILRHVAGKAAARS